MQTTDSKLKILVIDDSNTIRRSTEIFLKTAQHQVLLAEDGFDGLSKINAYQPDLVFCDILMPRLDGFKTCAIIKRQRHLAHLPVILLSSSDSMLERAQAELVGAQTVLTKPLDKKQLLGSVQQYAVPRPAA